MKINGSIEVPDEAIEAFCRKWKITQLEAFGSVLRNDFRPDSDIDLLVTFEPNSRTTLFDLVSMEAEMATLLGRPVDMITRKGIEQSKNYIRRKAILGSAQPLYHRA
jgi:predicted nucleotidyltransferase